MTFEDSHSLVHGIDALLGIKLGEPASLLNSRLELDLS